MFGTAAHYPTGATAESVAFGYLDGDQVPDLAVPNYDDDSVSVLLNLCQFAWDGDTNGDGFVDPLDSSFVLARFGCDVNGGDPSCAIADQNGDGLVDPLDVGFVLARFGSCGS